MSSSEGYSAPRDPLIGQIVQGRYEISHAIGNGAMGVVYEAQHLLIGRKVALKTMVPHSVSPDAVQRFRREARAATAVANSHVVDVLDMGQLDNGSFYLVMEYLEGVDLAFAVALEQRFSVGRALHVFGQLCDALSAIHAAGVVHRDLKPENIFLISRDGFQDFVKILDFGVCKFKDTEGVRLTATGDAIGTPLFMSPEQVAGHTDCDFRADIYALGALLYFVLTGQAPFDAPNLPALFMRICNEPAPSLSASDGRVSLELDAIVQRALSKDPNARFGSCSAFKAALRAVAMSPDELAATLPSASRDSRLSEYAWHVRDNGTPSLLSSQRRSRSPWLGFVSVVVGVAALGGSASSGAYLAREHSADLPGKPSGARTPRQVASPAAEAAVTLVPAPPEAYGPKPVIVVPAPPEAHAPKPHPLKQALLKAPISAAVPELPELNVTAPSTSARLAPPTVPASPTAPVGSVSASLPGLVFTRGPKRGL